MFIIKHYERNLLLVVQVVNWIYFLNIFLSGNNHCNNPTRIPPQTERHILCLPISLLPGVIHSSRLSPSFRRGSSAAAFGRSAAAAAEEEGIVAGTSSRNNIQICQGNSPSRATVMKLNTDQRCNTTTTTITTTKIKTNPPPLPPQPPQIHQPH